MLIDTHCHINSEELRPDARAVISRAREADVRKMLIVGCDYEDSCEAAAMAENFPQFGLYASIGIHPHEAKRYSNIPEEFRRIIINRKVVAVGEIGLDYHYNNSPKDDQIRMFEQQLRFAEETGKPVILHIREAMTDAMEMLTVHRGLKMLFHCYSGGLEFLNEVLGMGSMCAFGGAVTWNNPSGQLLREVVKHVPSENILCETDAPYMTPSPFRGKRNEPAYVKYVYNVIAREKGISVTELSRIVEDNAARFFGW
ncbi:MAG: TatD family hydrolase [Synergistaceae bacterium]|nr:TatD family hydrolase [Synergistaceae bacterium]MBQ9574966.1 TatD family hydrolase [Synergistaceae bacterium]